MPMLATLICQSLLSGCSVLLLKVLDTIFQSGGLEKDWWQLLVLAALVLLTGDIQLQFL